MLLLAVTSALYGLKVDYEQYSLFSVVRPRFARLAASPLPRACIALTKSEEKERLLAV